MILIISGHQRSGTTILRRVCDGHPQIRVANEFGCFADVGLTVKQAASARLAQWRLVNGRWAYDSASATHPRRHWHNLWFTLSYLWRLARITRGKVTALGVGEALRSQWAEAAVMGDKLPQYMPLLPQLLADHPAKVLLIYRDGRDVTHSFLEKVQTVWQDRAWANELNTAEKIARNWVTQIEQMKQLQQQYGPAQVHIIQYERFVTEPGPVLNDLAAWLGVNPAGFPLQQVRAGSIGKYRQGLTRQQIEQVESLAGTTLQQLGYEV